jgi:predicted negative regulator of RcsB-dependent stress response
VEEDYLSDKEQWERVLKWLREQGPWALAAVAMVAAGYAGWHYWQQHQEQRYTSAASRYEAVMEAFGRNNIDSGMRLADDLIRDFPSSGYADQANLAVARYQVEHNELDKALNRLSQVLTSTRDPELGLLTRLRVARVQLAIGKPDDALKTLNAVNAGAFAARYAQVRGDILLSKGDRPGALKEYQAAREGGETVDGGLLDLKIDELAHS